MKPRRAAPRHAATERAALVQVTTRSSREDPEASLHELEGLARAAGASVVLTVTQDRAAADPTTYIGRGKAASLAAACAELNVDLVIVDAELAPAQTSNLEDVCGRRVIDRTALILDIFARRARTREGRLQVELAQLEYLLPRLAGSSDALSRLGGGIGTRGPGETKLETDRRRIRQRLARLKSDIKAVAERRQYLRSRRERRDVPTVALVGYTNAGKTTLFNRLTGTHAVTSDALFVTLDPLVRRLRLPDRRQIMLSDTVGFIDRLPHQVVAAFHATLEEVAEADLLLHVVDATESDRERRASAVKRVLEEVGAGSVPVISVLNKIDRLPADARAVALGGSAEVIGVSAVSGEGVEVLLDHVIRLLAMDTTKIHVRLDSRIPAHQRVVEDLYRHAQVVEHQTTDRHVTIQALVPRRLVSRYQRHQVVA